jgi:hypothetical protein
MSAVASGTDSMRVLARLASALAFAFAPTACIDFSDASKCYEKTCTPSFELSSGEEFLGPFPSWANLKAQFGAVGDGVSDDSEAIETAMNSLGEMGHSSVLFMPAGT